jgi:hypothetical protein
MKKILALAVFVTVATTLFAYNPPAGGESIYRITEPNLLSDAGSASGGPLMTVVPGSITFNPALTALNQRMLLDVSYTGLIDTNNVNETDTKYGQGFRLGAIIPSKWCVSTIDVQGLFINLPEMDVGNSFIIHAGVAKDVNEQLYVGANMYTGFYFGNGSDFTIGADFGMLYYFKKLGFLKTPRLGVSIMNLGKPITGNYTVTGINGTTEGISYPGILTPHVSFAATLFDVKKISCGFSADLATPFFQNAVFDTAVAFGFADIVRLSIGWEANVRELVSGSAVNLPSVGLSVKFSFNSSGIIKSNADLAKSEMSVSAAWQQLYGGIEAVSAGALVNLGMQDTSAPEIILWDGQE